MNGVRVGRDRDWAGCGTTSSQPSAAALVIPESLGYAGVAGLPPEVGLYAAPLALLAYALLGRSTVLVVATSSSTAAISASVTAEVNADPASLTAAAGSLRFLPAPSTERD